MKQLQHLRLFDVLVPDDVTVVLNKLALIPRSPQSLGNRSVVLQVVGTQDLLNVNSGLLSVVEGHLGEEVVADVSVHNVVQSVIQQRAEGAVDSAQSTAQPVPLLSAEVGHEHVSVLQVGDQHQVIVHNGVGDQIEVSNSGKT